MKEILKSVTTLNSSEDTLISGYVFDEDVSISNMLPWLKGKFLKDAYFYNITQDGIISNWGYILKLIDTPIYKLTNEQVSLLEQINDNLLIHLDTVLLELLDTLIVFSVTNLNLEKGTK